MKILHSFPKKEKKFKEFCDLTFSLTKVENTFVDSLNDWDENFEQFDWIVIHCLRKSEIYFLQKNTIATPIIWFSWGTDIYSLLYIRSKVLLSKTRMQYFKYLFNASFPQSIRVFLEDAFGRSSSFNKKTFIQTLNKIDYIVPVMPGDFSILNQYYPSKLKLFHLNYANPLFLNTKIYSSSGNNILLGNSSSFTNNHFESIDILSKIDLQSRKVIIPLSYGNSYFAEKAKNYALKKLGNEKVEVLDYFMEFNAYQEIIISCSIIIMNHLRQQAVGNIVQALLSGGHIYLNKKSVVYQFLVENNFHVSVFDQNIILKGLNSEQQKKNFKLCNQIFGIEQQHKLLKQLLFTKNIS